jgi:hypothetical protein
MRADGRQQHAQSDSKQRVIVNNQDSHRLACRPNSALGVEC